jgi:hypothetical protein
MLSKRRAPTVVGMSAALSLMQRFTMRSFRQSVATDRNVLGSG